MMDIDLNKECFQSVILVDFMRKYGENWIEQFENLAKATQEARVHHQLMPMKLTYGILN